MLAAPNQNADNGTRPFESRPPKGSLIVAQQQQQRHAAGVKTTVQSNLQHYQYLLESREVEQ